MSKARDFRVRGGEGGGSDMGLYDSRALGGEGFFVRV